MNPSIKLYEKITAFLSAMVTNNPAIPPTPTTVDGVPVWTILPCEADDATLVPEPDGTACVIVPGIKSGACVVQVTADARKGEEVNNISATFTVNFEPLEADRLDITFGQPQPK